jgi:hypothetical protein
LHIGLISNPDRISQPLLVEISVGIKHHRDEYESSIGRER